MKIKTEEELADMSTMDLRMYADVDLLSNLDNLDSEIAALLETRRELSRHYLSVGQLILERVKNKD